MNDRRPIRPIRPNRPTSKAKPSAPACTAERLLTSFQAKLTPEKVDQLAVLTGVPADAWSKLNPGWCDADDLKLLRAGGDGDWKADPPTGAWCFAERDGNGRVIGLSLRATDGRKGFPTGQKRGLVVPSDLHPKEGVTFVVEGASDVAACCAIGVRCVGRPNNRDGAVLLAELLDSMVVLVLGECDGKPSGNWPGRMGAKHVAEHLASRWNEPVRWALPPDGAKDVREWLKAHPQPDKAAFQNAVESQAKTVKPKKRSAADALLDIGLQLYRVGRGEDGEPFAVELGGPPAAMPLQGASREINARLARAYHRDAGRVAGSSALKDAINAMAGYAAECEPEKVEVRVAERDGTVIIDLGGASGECALVSPSGVVVSNDPGVLFRRTGLTGRLPEPAADVGPEALLELRSLLNVADDSWPVVAGWLVAACMPGIPHPVLMLGGEQGVGKSTAASLLAGLIDPSKALLSTQPERPEQWTMTAANSWCIVVDNVSRIPPWLSDAFCRAVTGDGWVNRRLYTDSDLSVLEFQRCVILTSIDAGTLRGDLADRLLIVDLERIDDEARLGTKELRARYEEAKPRLFGGLIAAVSATLRELPNVDLKRLPRMADFARILAALDRACPELTGRTAFSRFMGQRGRIAADVIDADPFGAALLAFVRDRREWSGTAAQLLAELADRRGEDGAAREWPATPRALTGLVSRLAPALRSLGLSIDRKLGTSAKRERLYVLWTTGELGADEERFPDETGPACQERPATCRSCAASDSENVPTAQPADGSDGSDDASQRDDGTPEQR